MSIDPGPIKGVISLSYGNETDRFINQLIDLLDLDSEHINWLEAQAEKHGFEGLKMRVRDALESRVRLDNEKLRREKYQAKVD